jgi:ABC-2 type transport system ATP-binding protein
MDQTDSSAYRVCDLVKCYPGSTTLANDHIDLEIRVGEIFGLLGDNGAGKSTLVRQMVNLLRPTSGQISLFNRPIEVNPSLVSTSVGYMPQSSAALNRLTVAEAIYFVAHLRGRSREQARRESESLVDIWNLGKVRNSPSVRLSGGQKRLMGLAIAMAGRPPVLILDEPTNDLDPVNKRYVWEVLEGYNTSGSTIIFITHDAVEAERIVQRVGIMKGGKFIALGTPEDLKRKISLEMRIELHFSSPDPPNMPPSIPYEKSDGRLIIYVPPEHLSGVLSRVNLVQFSDIKIYPPTLEELYLHYATSK